MKIIILDLEASLSKPKKSREILEIGAIKLDENLKVISKFQAYVNPHKWYNRKNLVIDNKIVIPKDKIAFQRDINRIMYLFNKWVNHEGDDYVIATWSSSDINILIDNYYVTKFNLAWMKNYIDIQECFGKFIGSKNSVSLVNAYKHVNGENISLYNHSALNDAYNAAVVLKYLIINGYNFTYEKYPFKNIVCKLKKRCSVCGRKRTHDKFVYKSDECKNCRRLARQLKNQRMNSSCESV